MTSTKPISLDTMYTFDRSYHLTQSSLPIWDITRFYSILLDFTRIYSILLDFTRLYSILLGSTRFNLVLLGSTRFNLVLLGSTWFYLVLLGFTWFLEVLRWYMWQSRATETKSLTVITWIGEVQICKIVIRGSFSIWLWLHWWHLVAWLRRYDGHWQWIRHIYCMYIYIAFEGPLSSGFFFHLLFKPSCTTDIQEKHQDDRSNKLISSTNWMLQMIDRPSIRKRTK
jgi:hypothetical protein